MSDLATKKIIITGGHMTPAIAVIKELQIRKCANIVWVGHKHSIDGDEKTSAEFEVVTKNLHLKFINIETGKLYRSWFNNEFLKALKNLFLIPYGFTQALHIIISEKPDIIISFGGYLAFPIVFAAKLLRKKVITHEQTIVTGLANKLIGKWADLIAISWIDSEKYFDKRKVVFTGNPIREEVFQPKRQVFKFSDNVPTIYVTGGNQGAHVINMTIKEILPELLQKYNIIHQTGRTSTTNDFEIMNTFKKSLRESLQRRYEIRDYIYEDEIGDAYAQADFVISRAGANTCMELLALVKRAILVPIPWSSYNEQARNAELLKSVGLAIVLEENNLRPSALFDAIEKASDAKFEDVDFNGGQFNKMKEKTSRHVSLDAAKRLVDEIERVLVISNR